MSVSADPLSDRLSAIAHCMDELERVRGLWALYPGEFGGIQMAEADWLTELHSLLYIALPPPK